MWVAYNENQTEKCRGGEGGGFGSRKSRVGNIRTKCAIQILVHTRF